MKKIISILTIVLLAIIAVCPLSFAANNLTLTVTGDVAGRTLSVYKLFNLTVEDNDNTNYNGSIDKSSNIKPFMTWYYCFVDNKLITK